MMRYCNMFARYRKDRFLAEILFVVIILSVVSIFLGYPIADAKSHESQRRVKRFDLDSPVYRNYPKRFDGWGNIQRIDTNEIVIDDSLYRLSPRVTFHTPRMRNASKSDLGVGQSAGFIRNPSGEIKSLWLLILER